MKKVSANRSHSASIFKMIGFSQAPVDIEKAATALGFSIFPCPFPEKRKGKVMIEGKVKVILVNANHPLTLQRYTIAHELGHFINAHEHFEDEFIEEELFFLNHSFQNEREAELFAADLLMPKDFLEIDLSHLGVDVSTLASKYQVSPKAMTIRLNTLRLAEKYAHIKILSTDIQA